MKFLAVGILVMVIFPHHLLSAQITHAELRKEFPKAVHSEENCAALISKLEGVQKNDYISIAYRGAAHIVMAKYMSAPNKRLKAFNSGKEELELAIEKMPRNVELRYLRFTIQQNAPALLFYDDQETDLVFILDHLQDVKDDGYREKIKQFLRESGKCTEEQMAFLNQ